MRRSLPLLCAAISSLIGSFSLPIACIAVQNPGPTGIRDNDTFDRQAISGQLRQLDALVREIGKRDPVPQQEYEQAKLLGDQLLQESRRPGFFWLAVQAENAVDGAHVPAHLVLSRCLADLNVIALRVDQTDAIVLTGELHDFILRFFRDPETRRLQQLPPPPRDAEKRDYIAHRVYVETERLQGLRAYLRSQEVLSPKEWILSIGGLIWEGPQHLVWREDIAFASLEALQENGARITATGRFVTIRNKSQRLDLPIIHSMDLTGRSAYRDPAGRIYIPVEELARRKVAAVRLSPDPTEKTNKAISGSQIVYISPGVEPEYITPPERVRLPETRRKLPAEK